MDPQEYEEVKDHYSLEDWTQLTPNERLNEIRRLEKHKLLMDMALLPKGSRFRACVEGRAPPRSAPPRSASAEVAGPSGSGTAKRVRKTTAPTRTSSRSKRPCFVPPWRQATEAQEAIPSLVSEEAVDDPTTNEEDHEIEEDVIIESHILLDEEEDLLLQFMESERQLEQDKSNEVEQESPSENEEVDQQSGHEQEKENKNPRVRRKRPKVIRELGKCITKFNAMPPISEALQAEVMNNTYNKQTLMTVIKLHIKDKIGKAYPYPTPSCYQNLCEALIEKFPTLADIDNRDGYVSLKYKIRKSLSGETYRGNQKQLTENPTENRPPDGDVDVEVSNIYKEELKQGASSDNRTVFLIRTTLEDRQRDISPTASMNEVEMQIKSYPHYMNTEMLLYEYSLVIKGMSGGQITGLKELQIKASQMLQLVEAHNGEPDQIKAINFLQDKLVPNKLKKDNLLMLFTIKHVNEVQRELDTLTTTQQHHAPCVLVLLENREEDGKLKICKSLLKMGCGTISFLGPSSLKTVILQALAPYFIFGLKYPPAYESLLRFLEKSVHGFFCETTRKCREKQEYRRLMADFAKM